MKHLKLLIWLTQLGLSVALPFAGFLLLALWLRNQFHWGNWVLWIGILLGIISAIDGLRVSLKIMNRMAKEEEQEPPVSFNEHE